MPEPAFRSKFTGSIMTIPTSYKHSCNTKLECNLRCWQFAVRLLQPQLNWKDQGLDGVAHSWQKDHYPHWCRYLYCCGCGCWSHGFRPDQQETIPGTGYRPAWRERNLLEMSENRSNRVSPRGFELESGYL